MSSAWTPVPGLDLDPGNSSSKTSGGLADVRPPGAPAAPAGPEQPAALDRRDGQVDRAQRPAGQVVW
jgi:hypothetical protein